MAWSSYQQDIFNWLDLPEKRHLMVRAGAGCGKTTTIVELYKRIMAKTPGASVLFLAFNVKIAKELNERGVPAMTLNSLGFRTCLKNLRRPAMDENKIRKICMANKTIKPAWRGPIERIVNMLKAYLVPTTASVNEVLEIIQEFDLCDERPKPEFLDAVLAVFRRSVYQTQTLDFADQIAMPCYHQMPVRRYDYVIVDECQDLAPGKLELAARAVGKHFICVGDPQQAIYGFCGADSESMGKIIARFNPMVKTLPVTYRCGKDIVAEAHNFGVAPKDFQAGPDNHDGTVHRGVKYADFIETVKPRDFVLCRCTAPLMGACFRLLGQGIRARVIGRDIGGKLAKLADKINLRPSDGPDDMAGFCQKARMYEQEECNKLIAAEKNKSADALVDAVAALFTFACNSRTFPEMKAKIEAVFDDTVNPDSVTLSTIHRAKGLEADNVFCLASNSRKPKNEKQAQEERNLWYVMITRAKNNLLFVAPEEME